MNVLSLRKNMSDSLAYGRLHPQLEDNILLVDGEFFLFCQVGHKHHDTYSLSQCQGIISG